MALKNKEKFEQDRIDPEHDDDDAIDDPFFGLPSDEEFEKVNKMFKNRPLWQLNEEESELAHKVVDRVTSDQGTKGSGSEAHTAPKFPTSVYRSYVIRRVEMAEIEVYGKTCRLGSDIPPQIMDHVEFLQTLREREGYDVLLINPSSTRMFSCGPGKRSRRP